MNMSEGHCSAKRSSSGSRVDEFRGHDNDDGEYVPLKARRQQLQQTVREKMRKMTAEARKSRMIEASDNEEFESENIDLPVVSKSEHNKKSLLASSHKLRAEEEIKRSLNPDQEFEDLKAEEHRILNQVERSMNAPLLSVKERAKGIVYSERLKPRWKLPQKYANLTEKEIHDIREKFFIDVNSADVPPPIVSLEDMGFPTPILNALKEKGISHPTQIQMQGLPAALMSRDLIGIAFTGSGKTIVFVLPMVMIALEAEMRLPTSPGEGPYGLVVCPSRELATQTYETVEFFTKHLAKGGFPQLKSVCMIGGLSVSEQTTQIRKGVHMAVATPGRLNDMLNKRRTNLRQCIFLTMDEADRLIDLGFEEEIRNTLDHFQHQRQTLLFSATMPRKIQEFARSALVDPVVINVGRAGAANLDVVQEVEYVKQEAKLPYLMQCLQKTAPPVLIFCENKKDVDDVHEYLLLKNVDAVAIHSGLSQEDRQQAIKGFREGTKDVLVGTDVASKGLDFPAIQHVINFDMPKEIENYVHRIGRTGRCGRSGVATSFINKNQEQTVLLDLKALLVEAGQKIPPFFEALDSRGFNLKEIGGVRGCAYCGGLGHRIAQCPKLETHKNKQLGGTSKDFLTTGSRYGGTQGYAGDW